MEEIINRIRNDKRIVKELYDLIKSTIDFDIEIVDSTSLKELELISKLDEELTDIIYMIKDIKNS